MFMKSNLRFLALSALLITSEQVLGREQWLERDGRAVYLYPRRFGQEQPAVLTKIRNACPGAVCGTLAGQAVTPLLAAQPECSQQDMADAIIDASKQFDAATAALMVAAAVEYRQVEKNTPPDFTTNPPTLRNSVFCQKAPKNVQLNGLVQAQDPANDPNLFFDPAKPGASVRKGTQANTSPFNGGAAQPAAAATTTSATVSKTAVLIADPSATASDCVTAITVTVTGTVTATPTDAVTVVVGDTTSTDASVTTTAAATATSAVSNVGTADFGSCTVPEIEFGVGFDNRKETSFQPTDKQSFNHGSAQNIDIITQFICDTLTNSCKANQDAKTLCASAQKAADALPPKTGAQADAFNAVFGITTNFANVAAIDDQGRPVAGGAAVTTTAAPANTATATQASTSAAASVATTAVSSGSSGVGNFGKCSVPQIEFGAGFDGRKETSFEPVDKASFNHGSAQNIDIITQFICDTLTNTCGADQTAKTTCASATSAASAAAKGTGAQADAFNQVFGISTNFASVAQIDNQGKVVGAASVSTPAASSAAPSATAAANTSTNNASTNNAVTVPSAAKSGNLQTFAGALGGVAAPAVTSSGNGQFQVAGNSSFNNQKNAVVRSCDVQNNQCADAANASGNKNGFTVSACNAQQSQCIAAAN
ncbi:hypothetical protein BDN70DRAFT_885017 [Pholiota conissans]|uniref:Uncharacterized protein n=1 Tax=Pholiota conissans TaxID=109636 RepID=A0A9P6CUV9_9AGAR|nr:hypothetical protein BDN70DRAFT_885017 [Pholiota conissans]